jgi:hypothetical protein
MIGAMSSNGSANMSCRTKASLSAGVSVSSTTSNARPTESASSAPCSGLLSLAERPEHPVGNRPEMRPVIFELPGEPFLLIHVTFLLRSVSKRQTREIRGV